MKKTKLTIQEGKHEVVITRDETGLTLQEITEMFKSGLSAMGFSENQVNSIQCLQSPEPHRQ